MIQCERFHRKGVVFHRPDDTKPGALEAESQSSQAGKKIDGQQRVLEARSTALATNRPSFSQMAPASITWCAPNSGISSSTAWVRMNSSDLPRRRIPRLDRTHRRFNRNNQCEQNPNSEKVGIAIRTVHASAAWDQDTGSNELIESFCDRTGSSTTNPKSQFEI